MSGRRGAPVSTQKPQAWKDGHIQGYKDAEKAYGACHFCYGKGYSTFNAGKNISFCECERGQQLAEVFRKWPTVV